MRLFAVSRRSSSHAAFTSASNAGIRSGVDDSTKTTCQPYPDSIRPAQAPDVHTSARERRTEFLRERVQRAIAVMALEHRRGPCRRVHAPDYMLFIRRSEGFADSARDGVQAIDAIETGLVRAADAGVADLREADARIIATSDNFGGMAGIVRSRKSLKAIS
jgi:hypothetical protein